MGKYFVRSAFRPLKFTFEPLSFTVTQTSTILTTKQVMFAKGLWIILLVVVQKELQKVGNTMFGESINRLKLPNESGKHM